MAKVFNNAAEIEEFYRAAARNLVDFYRIVCYDGDDEKYLPPAHFHYQLSDILLKSNDSFAIQAFRDSGKTSLSINAFGLYQLSFAHYSSKNTYIILVKQSQTLAAEKVREIKEAYFANPLLNIDLVKVVKDNATEGIFEIEVKGGRRIRLEAKGKGSGIRGAMWRSTRPTIVILDDIQDLDDVNSDTVVERDWKWFIREITFLGTDTRVFMIGNNLGERCLIEKVFKFHKTLNFKKPLKTMRIPVRTPDGELTWEAKYPHEEIDRILEGARKNDTLEDIYAELFCESITEETRKFKRTYFRYYPLVNVERLRQECNIYITCDLAMTSKKKSDNSAIFVQGINQDGYRFYLDCEYGKLDEVQIMDAIFALVSKYKPKKVGIEKVAFQRLWKFILEREMGKRNIFFEIVEIEAVGEKEARIAGKLLPLFKTGYVWFPENAKWLQELENELLMFPKGAHDDIIDAASMGEDILEKPIGFEDFGNVDWEQMPKVAGGTY